MAQAKRPRIKDVAAVASVSVAAVSRYLNKQIELPRETASRIDRAVEKLGYRPSIIAQRLSRGKSEMIGLVTSDIAYPFFAAIASSAEEEARRRGYSVIICNTGNELSREIEYIDKLQAQHVDGLIFLTNHFDDGTLRNRLNQCSNLVLVDEDVLGTTAHKIFAENEAGGRIATQHLINAGHTRIAHITGLKGLASVEERLGAYRRTMKASGLSVEAGYVQYGTYNSYDETIESGYLAFQSLWSLSNPPTAVFAAADALAIGFMDAARAHGLSIPRDLSVIGFDDMPFAKLLNPPLTTIRQSATEFGRRSVRRLLSLIDNEVMQGEVERVPVELVIRQSVGPPNLGDAKGQSKTKNEMKEDEMT